MDQHEAAGGDKQKTLKEVSREGKISPLRSRKRVPRWLKRERDRQEEREMSWAKRPVQWMSNQQGDAPGNSGQTGPRQQSTSQADPVSNWLYSNAYSNADEFQRDRTDGSEQGSKQSRHRRTPVNRGEHALAHPVCATIFAIQNVSS